MKLTLSYNYKQKRRASTLLALAKTELDAAEALVAKALHRESVVHLYFSCYYASQTFLIHKLQSQVSHRNLNNSLHKIYGKHKTFPRRYVEIHSFLYKLRTSFNYQHTHSPSPSLIERKLRITRDYVKFTFNNVPKIDMLDIMQEICTANKDLVNDFSYDIYCPKTYFHHTRLTFWHPPFYLKFFSPKKVCEKAKRMLSSLKVKRSQDYVLGLNSRLDQYKAVHLIMLDIDTLDTAVEEFLHRIGGVLMKSGRGLHFISNKPLVGQSVWEKEMKRLCSNKEFKKYVDKDHIAISIQRGYSTLRITSSPSKPFTPIFFKDV